MPISYRASLTCCCLFVLAALAGCAAPSSGTRAETYQPAVPPGMTWADAVNVLLTTVQDRNQTSAGIKCRIENNRITIQRIGDGHVLADFGFFKLLDQHIVVDDTTRINLPGLIALRFASRGDAEKAADALFFMQQHLKNYRTKLEDQLAKFESVAAQYRARETKPALSEEQRKLIVQANAFTEKKQYFEAREKYRAVIALDPTSYPAAYYNLALLEAQMNLPFAAITYMKHYLLLGPEAPDARGAQDKIYEWELLLPASFAREATTRVSTDPPDALVELNVSDSGQGWIYLGRAPATARFWRTDPKLKSCLIRAGKPGYATEERSFPFESLPPEVHIPLRPWGSGEDTHGYLGISFVAMTEEVAHAAGLPAGKGVVVKELAPGSPGARAGLQPGDIILAVDGADIEETIDLPRVAASTPIGAAVELKILRKGQAQTVAIKVGKLPN